MSYAAKFMPFDSRLGDFSTSSLVSRPQFIQSIKAGG